MSSSRDVGGHDYADPVRVPGPLIRSRHVDTEQAETDTDELVEYLDEVRCPTCGSRFPGVATACPDDGTALRAPSREAGELGRPTEHEGR